MAALLKKQSEDAGRIRELERVRDELTQMIVKDMKTPLTGLADMLELADRTSLSPFQAETSEFINDALGATETLEELVDLLLDVRRMMAGTIQLSRARCDLFQLTGSVAGLLGEAAHAKGITLEVKGEPAFALCDVQMVSRVVRHLLRNAINSNPRGANVRVTVSRAGAYVKVAVSGQGDEDVSSLGAGFEQHALLGDGKPASGLGSTFFRLAVDAHHGMFGTEVEPGTSLTRWFSLPADDSGAEDQDTVTVPDAHPLAARSRRYLGRHRPEPLPEKANASLVSRDTRYQLAVAVALMSSIPLLAFAYLLNGVLRTDALNLRVVYLMTPVVAVLVGLGIVLLLNHTREVSRLRRYLALMAKGGIPKINFEGISADFTAIERDLGEVVKQTDEKVRIIESQSKELLQSEQQRVMVETVGAACHHLGQPATVIAGYLDLMRKKETSPELQGMIDECQAAAADVHNVLHRLQDVARYQAEPYLLRSAKVAPHPDARSAKP
jgi:signal transduction histidine kinase